jgi:hypothetical protein
MTKTNINTKHITLLTVLIMLFAAAKSQAQCSWSISATSQESTCAANGTVTVTLNNPGGAVTGILYRLAPLSNSFEIPQSESKVFSGVPAGTYRVVATGLCNGVEDSVFADVTVSGNYVPFSVASTKRRSALNGCNNGQINTEPRNGRAPYTIKIRNVPAAYTGDTSFVTSESFYVIDSLAPGSYTIVVTDACNSTTDPQTVTVPSLALSPSQFWVFAPEQVPDSCNKLRFLRPAWQASEDFQDIIQYSITVDGVLSTPYRSIWEDPEIYRLPDGKTLKDLWGKTFVFNFTANCGAGTSVSGTFFTPTLYSGSVVTCRGNYNVSIGVSNYTMVCGPITYTLKNNATEVVQTNVSGSSWYLPELPPGNYDITATDASGNALGTKTGWVLPVPDPANPYTISAAPNDGDVGNDSATYFTLYRGGGIIPAKTKIELIENNRFTYSFTLTADWQSFSIERPDNESYFKPGTYKFRITDGCTDSVYELPITVNPEDVYIYTTSITTVPACTGLQITPTGSVKYKNTTSNVYFQILYASSSGYDNRILPSGSTFTVTNAGTYGFGVTIYRSWGSSYVRTFVPYDYQPLTIDDTRTYGWVCPGLSADSGYIYATGTGGRKGAESAYTYQLAAEGQGNSGPYLAVNTTGKFSTSASGGTYVLTRGHTYDVKITDGCGASVVQPIRIVDLATAQIATSDQPEYCLGDEIQFRVANLPSTAITYQWTGPDGFSSNVQNPVRGPVTEKHGGNYHVTISADICKQPINADVNIVLASYITSCYSAITDRSVNPYAYGLLGAWRPSRSYTYYGARAESDPSQGTNIRKDGAFNDFMAFWQKQTDGWKAQTTDPNWVWNSQTTLFNKKGFELENKDPLGRYNAGIYGYDNAVPVAVIQNSRYSESTFDGFEDYAFESSNCDDGKCPVDRRFNLSGAATRIVNSEYHTGRYSLKVTNDDKDSIAIMMPVTATAEDPSDPAFNKMENDCPPYDEILESVQANKNVLLPPISLLSGKKAVVSAWVKEAQDCKCTSYTNSYIKVVVKGADASSSAIYPATPAGAIIDGWQRIEQVVDLPAGSEALSLILLSNVGVAYFDDIRVHPYNANMKSFVYDAQNLRLMAELDENNYATFYEYDDDGTLTRVKKETERGVKTIKETRSALVKEAVDEDPNIETY